MNRIITLITDFGYKDPFVGQMKGVILRINPLAKIVDITHHISSHDIEEAAHVISESYKYFPEETIHVVVVDPTVGSKRKALVVKAKGHFFLSPDNGILSYFFNEGDFEAYVIENEKYLLRKDSPTFQGRDLFAPVAAHLSKGLAIEEFGTSYPSPVRINFAPLSYEEGKIVGAVVRIDKFGNLITNIKVEKDKVKSLEVKGINLPLVACYADSQDKPAALINSDGFLEIFLFRGSAAKTLLIEKGEKVEVKLIG